MSRDYGSYEDESWSKDKHGHSPLTNYRHSSPRHGRYQGPSGQRRPTEGGASGGGEGKPSKKPTNVMEFIWGEITWAAKKFWDEKEPT